LGETDIHEHVQKTPATATGKRKKNFYGYGAEWRKDLVENPHKPDDVLRFMEDVLPKPDKMDFIECHAWFPAGLDNKALGTSALFDGDGKLTRFDECYRDA
jgi:hypothetical protein